jgi:hypothetical protein
VFDTEPAVAGADPEQASASSDDREKDCEADQNATHEPLNHEPLR